jgi:hypothetical protein
MNLFNLAGRVGLVAAATALSAGVLTSVTSTASTGVVADGSASPSARVAHARGADHVKVTLQPSNGALQACFPDARAKVNVALTTDDVGKDEFRIRARGLQPRTDFTVFLLEQSGSPFGAAEYIGDFTTDKYGQSSATFDLIVEEAFAFNNATQSRTDLNSIGFWFADETADDACLGAASPVTGFDGDAAAGVQMMNSGTQLLP